MWWHEYILVSNVVTWVYTSNVVYKITMSVILSSAWFQMEASLVLYEPHLVWYEFKHWSHCIQLAATMYLCDTLAWPKKQLGSLWCYHDSLWYQLKPLVLRVHTPCKVRVGLCEVHGPPLPGSKLHIKVTWLNCRFCLKVNFTTGTIVHQRLLFKVTSLLGCGCIVAH